MSSNFYKGAVLFILFQGAALVSLAQLERRTVSQEKQSVELMFDAPRAVTFWTVESLPKNELHISIMHNFGTVDNGARNLFGMDNGANVRLGFEYGVSDKLSTFVGRSSLDKMFDGGFRYAILKQTTDGSIPLSVSGVGTVGFTAAEYRFLADPGYTTGDRWSYAASLLLARKFSDAFSLQLAPTMALFNRVGNERNLDGNEEVYFSLVSLARYKITKRTAITAQYVPSFDANVRANLGFGVDIDTGGHVFQVFLSNTPAFNDMYLLAGQNGDITQSQFRLGFNVNRTFSTK